MKRKKKFVLEDLAVTSYAAEGKALGRVDGKVIFVEGVVPGDVVDVLITKNKKDWAEGKATKIKELSKERVEPFCIHFGVCGGCKWQMLPYQKQLEYKEQETVDAFKRIGHLKDIPVLPIIGSEKIIHYRNKLEFTFSNKIYLSVQELKELGDDAWPGGALGYHVHGLYDKIVDIYECWLMDDVNNKIRNSIREFAMANNYSYYNVKDHNGWLRNIVIRNCDSGELMVNLIFGYDDKKERERICNFLLEQAPSITTLLFTINAKWNDSIYDLNPQIVFGKGYVIEKLGDYNFKISPKSFFQTNTKQAERLYNIVKDFAGLTGNEIIYDLYCGTGSIGIFLSAGAKKIIGVDVIEDAIKDAKENAALNNISHATFFCGDVIEICGDKFFMLHGRPDVIVVDPPRAGLHAKLIDKIIEIAPGKIVYVSCNVATQARDIQLLSEKFSIENSQPVDMFPHTHHIECVAELRLKQ
ncbi:MAG TPA: 23S rRNA (uracil(1939)-C(5))-methyltransferase RlmD [Chitinophagaceae bacterium]|nr:23S rRNA (uracil(1939)-C(5))-methyltransferase RlmD [Chitinophagaceae bacterium]